MQWLVEKGATIDIEDKDGVSIVLMEDDLSSQFYTSKRRFIIIIQAYKTNPILYWEFGKSI